MRDGYPRTDLTLIPKVSPPGCRLSRCMRGILFALVCLALLPPVEAQFVPRTTAGPSGRGMAAPAKPGSVLTADEQKRLTEVLRQMTSKERKRFTKAVQRMTPEQRKKFAAVLKQRLAKRRTGR